MARQGSSFEHALPERKGSGRGSSRSSSSRCREVLQGEGDHEVKRDCPTLAFRNKKDGGMESKDQKRQLSKSFAEAATKVVGVEERVNVYDDKDVQGLPLLGGWSSKLVFWVGFLVSALSVYELLIGNFEPALQRPLR